jgi:hypothetical protein
MKINFQQYYTSNFTLFTIAMLMRGLFNTLFCSLQINILEMLSNNFVQNMIYDPCSFLLHVK